MPALDQLRDSLSRYGSLILYKTYAELRAESERTYVGFLWWFVDPIVMMLVYYMVFTVILKTRSQDFLAFLFIGILSWRWFSTSIMHGANSILSARGLMQQVYLPKVIFPIVAVLTDTVKFLIVLTVLLVVLPFFGFPLAIAHLALIPVVVAQFLLVTGCATFAAAVVPLLPDLRMVLQNGLRMVFFLSGIFYDINVFPEEIRRFLYLNPMAVLIKMYRGIILEGTAPSFLAIGAIIAAGVTVGLIGYWVTRRLDFLYPKMRY